MSDQPPVSARGYVICTTPRSGSNYLCALLRAGGGLGRPLDYFNTAGRRAREAPDWPEAADEQLTLAMQLGATPNGVYGLKLMGYDLDRLTAVDWTARLPELRFIHLHRRARLDQAISLVMARQTGQWRSTDAVATEPTYDGAAIERERRALARQDSAWRSFFEARGVAPLSLAYEDLIAAPEAALSAIADLMGEPPPTGPAPVELNVQRTGLNAAWRQRFLEEGPSGESAWEPETGRKLWFFTRPAARPRLTVSIQTRQRSEHLSRLLSEVRSYADEVLVGVDASTDDDSFEVASELADVAYRFELPARGLLAPARLIPFRLASGDWILNLDDDEGMVPSFEAVLPQLLEADGITHHYLARRWVVDVDPPRYFHQPPWWPNWSLRLIRNDVGLVWKPSRPHSQLSVAGPGRFETRTSILHFEPLIVTDEARSAKVRAYTEAGADPAWADFYDYRNATETRPCELRAPSPPSQRSGGATLYPEPLRPVMRASPPWAGRILELEASNSAIQGAQMLFRARILNTGALIWGPGARDDREWSRIGLACRLNSTDAPPAPWDWTPFDDLTAPGGTLEVIGYGRAPNDLGEQQVVWDLYSPVFGWLGVAGGERRLMVTRTHATLHSDAPLIVASGLKAACQEGWYEPEPQGIWSGSHSATLGLKVFRQAGVDVVLRLRFGMLVAPGRPRELQLSAGGHVLVQTTYEESFEERELKIAVADDWISEAGEIDLALAISDLVRPSEVTSTHDTRLLGVELRSIALA